ncbi:MAG TPA: glycosyltransferase family 2 protein [Opitutaceae bacterium]
MNHSLALESVSLTIAVCTFNRAAFLARMLASINRQTEEAFELLVLDDCSTDDTAAICQSFASARCRYVRNPANLGFNANYNRAITLATTSHVLVTHDDDYMDPPFVAHLFRGIARYLEAVMIVSNVWIIAEEGLAATPGVTGPVAKVIDSNALRLTEDKVFLRGEYGEANYWGRLGLYCPTFCFHRERFVCAGIVFEPVGPGSDVLISLRANLVGPIAVLSDVHFNVCSHPGQDHSSIINELSAGYRLDRVATPIVRNEPVYTAVRSVAEFNLSYHFGKAATAALMDLPGRPAIASSADIYERYGHHLASLPPEVRGVVFSSGRNRVGARLFGHAGVLHGVPRIAAAKSIRVVPQLSTHHRKWSLLNFTTLDRLDDLLAENFWIDSAPPLPIQGRTVIVWGFSYIGIVVAELLRRLNVRVEGFVDRNAKLHGARFREFVCRSWHELRADCASTGCDPLIITATEGQLDVDLAFEFLEQEPPAAQCTVRNWRAVVDWLDALAEIAESMRKR